MYLEWGEISKGKLFIDIPIILGGVGDSYIVTLASLKYRFMCFR